MMGSASIFFCNSILAKQTTYSMPVHSQTENTAILANDIMPPPCKVMRRGSQELDDAIQNGHVKLSLPQTEWTSWIAPNHEQQWHAYETCETGESTSSLTVSTVSCSEGHSSMAIDDDPRSTIPTPRSPEQPHDQGYSSVNSPEASQRKENNPELLRDNSLPRFSDIIGHSAVKLRLDEVLLPLALPPALADEILVGVRSLSASILLFGPPGCGKTQLAKAIAGEAEAAFLSAGPSDIMSKFVGESEGAIRSLFDQAYEQARKVRSKCAVIFFDEVDALGQSRGGIHSDQSSSADPSSRRVLAELLIQMNRVNAAQGRVKASSCSPDDVGSVSMLANDITGNDHRDDSSSINEPSSSDKSRVHIVVVAATNRPEDCDAALLRRFAVRVMVNLPTRRDRKKILKRYLKDIHHSISSEHLHALSLEMQGWTGSDLESLTREAAMAPVRECIRTAALMKRRGARLEQQAMHQQLGGSSTCQQGSSMSHEKHALEQFSNLRPVSVLDFMNAISFWAYNHGTNDVLCIDGTVQGSFDTQTIHYDSSSDEED